MQFDSKQLNVAIDISASGDNTIISAPTTGYLAIDHVNFIPTTAVGVVLKNGSTANTGTYPLDAKQALTVENPSDWRDGVITCLPGEAFVINLDAAVQVSGMVRYRIIG